MSRESSDNTANQKEEKVHVPQGSLYNINCSYVTQFLNKTSFSKFSMFILALALFEAFEILVCVKQWSILWRRCFDGSELSVGLLCSFHLTLVLCLVSPIQREPQKQSPLHLAHDL